MNKFGSFSIAFFVGALLVGTSCNTKGPARITQSVEDYYKGLLPISTIGVIATDWDHVVSVSDKWSRWLGIAQAVVPKTWSAIKLLTAADVRADIAKARKLELKDVNNKQIYGAGNYIDYFAQKYDPSLGEIKQPLVRALSEVKPIYSTVALYQQLNIPVVVWTNNDYESYEGKLKNLNQKLQPEFKGTPFTPVAAFVAGENPALSENAYSIEGKPDAEYYKKAYAYTKNKMNLGDTDAIIFVDDQADNIDAARQVAKDNNLPIIAIQYTTPEQLEHDFALLIPAIQQAPADYIAPKELDEYLLNREEREAFS